jgi:hypothetical protein
VIADDDVRYDADALRRLLDRLRESDLVRPQNYFDPLPWHARWDTARTLLNRSFGADFPGTLGVRRSRFLAMGGYDGDVLFENLELIRTVRADGGQVDSPLDLYVRRPPPSSAHFRGQRVRQAYDDLALPTRMALELALIPAVALGLSRRRPGPLRDRRVPHRLGPLRGHLRDQAVRDLEMARAHDPARWRILEQGTADHHHRFRAGRTASHRDPADRDTERLAAFLGDLNGLAATAFRRSCGGCSRRQDGGGSCERGSARQDRGGVPEAKSVFHRFLSVRPAGRSGQDDPVGSPARRYPLQLDEALAVAIRAGRPNSLLVSVAGGTSTLPRALT